MIELTMYSPVGGHYWPSGRFSLQFLDWIRWTEADLPDSAHRWQWLPKRDPVLRQLDGILGSEWDIHRVGTAFVFPALWAVLYVDRCLWWVYFHGTGLESNLACLFFADALWRRGFFFRFSSYHRCGPNRRPDRDVPQSPRSSTPDRCQAAQSVFPAKVPQR